MTEKKRRAQTLERVTRRMSRLIKDGDELLSERDLFAVLFERDRAEWGEPLIDVSE